MIENGNRDKIETLRKFFFYRPHFYILTNGFRASAVYFGFVQFRKQFLFSYFYF